MLASLARLDTLFGRSAIIRSSNAHTCEPKGSTGSPTYQYHGSVLHVFQFTHASVFGLLPLYCCTNDVQ